VNAFILIVLAWTAAFARVQLLEAKRTQELRVASTILWRYLEDRGLFETRAFIHGHMDEINKNIEEGMKEADKALQANRDKIREEIDKRSGGKQSLTSVELVASTLNQASWLIQQGWLESEVAEFLTRPIARIYPKLRPFIEFEWLRRGDQKHRYAEYLVSLGEATKTKTL
jgi:hypothetical protein